MITPANVRRKLCHFFTIQRTILLKLIAERLCRFLASVRNTNIVCRQTIAGEVENNKTKIGKLAPGILVSEKT